MDKNRNISYGFLAVIAGLALIAGGSLSAQNSAKEPAISLEQRTSLRCAAAFAIVAQGQARGNAGSLGWPPLGERGREFFVRISAQLMDDAGLERTTVATLLQREAKSLTDKGQVQQVMPSCLILLETSGL